jgi:hypothetical protein
MFDDDLENGIPRDNEDEEKERLGRVATPTRIAPPPAPASGGLRGLSPLTIAPATQQRTDVANTELTRLQDTGSGISQIKNPFARGALKVADTIGSIVAPRIERAIPGTEGYHRGLIGREQSQIETGLGDEAKQAGIGKTEAETGEAQARTKGIDAATAAAGQPKPKEEIWKTVPGVVGPNGKVLQEEQNSGQVRWAPGIEGAGPLKEPGTKTEKITRVVNGVPHEVLVNSETGEDVKDEGQTKIPGESPDQKRSAAEQAQVEREARTNIRKASEQYRATQQSVHQMQASIDAAKDGNGLLTSFVPTMEVLGINASNGVHRISPAEAQAAQLPGGWVERFNAWFDKATTGKLSPQLQSEGKQLGKILADSAYQRYKSLYDDESGIVSGYGGKDFGKRVPLIQSDEAGAQGGEPTRPSNVPTNYVYQKNGPKGEGWYRP